ncbi:MAG: hypothetical protein H7Y15_12260 [Pseudonocardia sp.]|nr:hypothetical protein [Pseudonocardia sp.]
MTAEHDSFACTVLAFDLEAYGHRDGPGQRDAQRRLVDVVASAAHGAGLDATEWTRQESGDGLLLFIPATVPLSRVLADLTREIELALAVHNRDLVRTAHLRARMSVGAGEVGAGANGYTGAAVIDVARVIGHDEVRAVLRAEQEWDLVAVVSDRVYQDVVPHRYRGLAPEQFRRMHLVTKERSLDVWLRIPPSRTRQHEVGAARATSTTPGAGPGNVHAQSVRYGGDDHAHTINHRYGR